MAKRDGIRPTPVQQLRALAMQLNLIKLTPLMEITSSNRDVGIDVKVAITGHSTVRRTTVIPPVLDAWAA